MGFKAFIKAFFAIFWGILMVFFVKFWGIKILSLVISSEKILSFAKKMLNK